MSIDFGGRTQEEIDELVDETITDNEVVLFMKGTSDAPQCGYSDTALNRLRRHRENVECVNVLAATEEFRNALERHSGWSTIPQAYVNGDFIGGSDVLVELDEQGELAKTLEV